MLAVFRSTQIAGQDLVHEDTNLETLEDMVRKFRHLAHCDPYQDVLIAEVGGAMVAYGRVSWWQLQPGGAPGAYIYFMAWHIRPEWRGQGLEQAFLHHNQVRLRQVIQEQEGQVLSGERFFQAVASSAQPELARLLEEDGFTAYRWTCRMTCSDLHLIPDLPMPVGLEVRRVAPDHYRPIWDALCDAFQDDPGYAPPSEDDYVAWQQSSQFQPDLWQVAWDGSQVAGMVLNYIARDSDGDEPATAWTEDICVRRPWRQRGLARALLARSMRMFHQMGFSQTCLGADFNNREGAHQLYASMGYQVISTQTSYRKPVD